MCGIATGRAGWTSGEPNFWVLNCKELICVGLTFDRRFSTVLISLEQTSAEPSSGFGSRRVRT